jgi:hypothetical protein
MALAARDRVGAERAEDDQGGDAREGDDQAALEPTAEPALAAGAPGVGEVAEMGWPGKRERRRVGLRGRLERDRDQQVKGQAEDDRDQDQRQLAQQRAPPVTGQSRSSFRRSSAS